MRTPNSRPSSATQISTSKRGPDPPLPWDLYKNSPKTNLFAPAYRKVQALRVSSEFERKFGDGALSLTPYFRNNTMNLNGSYNFSSDPRIEKTESQSYRPARQMATGFSRVRTGQGHRRHRPRKQSGLAPGRRPQSVKTGAGASTNFTGYTTGRRIYDYDVTFQSVSALPSHGNFAS
jgi:hypothetical protein